MLISLQQNIRLCVRDSYSRIDKESLNSQQERSQIQWTYFSGLPLVPQGIEWSFVYARKDFTCTASCLIPLSIDFILKNRVRHAKVRYIGRFRLVRRGLTHRTTYVAEGLYSLITTTQLSGARSTSWANSPPFWKIRPLTLLIRSELWFWELILNSEFQ